MATFLAQRFGGMCALAGTSGPAFTNFTFDASTDQLEFIFQAPPGGSITITKLGFRYGARIGTPPTFKLSLQGVDGTGIPDGTIKGGASPASATFTPPADTSWDGLWKWITLDNSYATTNGEFLALVIAYNSGTINVANGASFTSQLTVIEPSEGLPYSITNNAGVRTRNTGLSIYGFSTSSTAYGRTAQALVASVFNSGSNPNEYALAFNLPSTWLSTYQIAGIRIFFSTPAAGKTVTIALYDGTTVLQNVVWDTDDVNAVTGTRPFTFLFDEATLSTLIAGTVYRIGFLPVDAGTSITFRGIQTAVAGDFDAWPGGQQFYQSTRNGGAWTDDTTKRPLAELLITDWTEPAGGAGMLVHPGMSGGMRG